MSILAVVTAFGFSGCAVENNGGPRLLGRGERGISVGDWDDIDNAVSVASAKSEMAIVSMAERGGHERVYELLSITEDFGRVTVRRVSVRGTEIRQAESTMVLAAGDGIEVEAQVGRFGNADRERRLIADIQARINDLAGVDFAPVR